MCTHYPTHPTTIVNSCLRCLLTKLLERMKNISGREGETERTSNDKRKYKEIKCVKKERQTEKQMED